MSSTYTSAVWSLTNISPGQKLIMLALAEFSDISGTVHADRVYLAQLCNIELSILERTLDKLHDNGFIIDNKSTITLARDLLLKKEEEKKDIYSPERSEGVGGSEYERSEYSRRGDSAQKPLFTEKRKYTPAKKKFGIFGPDNFLPDQQMVYFATYCAIYRLNTDFDNLTYQEYVNLMTVGPRPTQTEIDSLIYCVKQLLESNATPEQVNYFASYWASKCSNIPLQVGAFLKHFTRIIQEHGDTSGQYQPLNVNPFAS